MDESAVKDCLLGFAMDSPQSVVSPFKIGESENENSNSVQSSGNLSNGTNSNGKDSKSCGRQDLVGTLEVYVHQGLESQELNGRKRGSTTISVEGYDPSVYEYSLKLALTKHFASCGKIVDIFVPRDFKRRILMSPLFLTFSEGGPVDKALELNGSDVGGWNVVVKAVPRPKHFVDHARFKFFNGERDEARISIVGKGCVEKAQKLSGGRNAQGWNIVVDAVLSPAVNVRKSTGIQHPSIVLESLKKAKMENMEKMEKMESLKKAKMEKMEKKMEKMERLKKAKMEKMETLYYLDEDQ